MDEQTLLAPVALLPALERLLTSPRLRLAVWFGSGARGALRPDSDLDIGVVPRGDLSLDDELGLQVAIERATGRRVDLVRLDRAAPLLCFEVARDGVPIHQDPVGAWEDFRVRAMVDWWDWAPQARRLEAVWLDRLRQTGLVADAAG